MNNLSWLLYWADVLPSLSTLLVFVFGLLFFGSCGVFFFYVVVSEDTDEKPPEGKEWRNCTREEMLRSYSDDARVAMKCWHVKYICPTLFFLWAACFLVPSKDTFYMIAASEAGGEVIQSPEFVKIRAVINQYLDDKLAEKK